MRRQLAHISARQHTTRLGWCAVCACVLIGCSGCGAPSPSAASIDSWKILERFAAETHSTIESSDASGGDVSDDNFRTYCSEWVIHVPSGTEDGFIRGFRDRILGAVAKKNGTIDDEGSGVRHDNGAVTQFSYTIRFGSRYAFITVRPRWIPSGSWIPQGTGKKALFVVLTQVDFP